MLNKGRFFFFVMFFVLITTAVFLVSANNLSTKLNVPASPPFLVKPIPNQTWALNTNLTEAFNLNNYFESFFNKNLTYTYTPIENISVLISSNGSVSFFPDFDFNGKRTISFNASDGNFSEQSNLVYLDVKVDKKPPTWSDLSYKPTKIYQNTYVDFNASWKDDIQLSRFILSIYQGGAWENYSTTFKGLSNFSSKRVQISASGGSIVYWYFCGYDTSNNVNCTATKNFTVLNHQFSSPSSGPTSYSQPQDKFFPLFSRSSKTDAFDVNKNFLRVSLKQGFSKTKILKISNTGTSIIMFNLSSISLKNFTKFSTKNFSLGIGDSKIVTIDFKAGRFLSPGEYFGAILISSSSSISNMSIPVAIDVNPYVLNFKVNVTIPDHYKNVNPGKEVFGNISIMNLKDVPSSQIKLYYAVKDFSGNIYNSSFSNLTLTNRINLIKSLKIPLDSNPGNYIFYARVSLENESAIDSDVFQVGSTFNFNAFFKYGSIIFSISILTIISMILFFKYRKEHEKKKLLNLYLMVSLLQKLIKEGNTESALNLFIRIKSAYGEKVSESAFDNKEKLREEINALSEKLQKQIGQNDSSKQNDLETSNGGSKKEVISKNMKEKKSIGDKKEEYKENSKKRNTLRTAKNKQTVKNKKKSLKQKSKNPKRGKKK